MNWTILNSCNIEHNAFVYKIIFEDDSYYYGYKLFKTNKGKETNWKDDNYRMKCSNARKGKSPSNKGIPMSDETKLKCSIKAKENWKIGIYDNRNK